jgi:hypothetical protein
MNTLVLDTTSKSINVNISGSPSPSLDFTAHWADVNSSANTMSEASTDGSLSSGSSTVISAPASNHVLLVKELTIQNSSGSGVSLTVNFVDGASIRKLWNGTLANNNTWSLGAVFDSTGALSVGTVGPTGAQGATGATGSTGATGATGASGSIGQLNNTTSTLSNYTYSGISAKFTAAQAQAAMDACYINSSGNPTLANSSAIANAWASVMAADQTIASGSSGDYLILGFIRNDSITFSTVGGPVYLATAGTTGNTLTQTAPSGANNVIQILGIAVASHILLFMPQLAQVEHV